MWEKKMKGIRVIGRASLPLKLWWLRKKRRRRGNLFDFEDTNFLITSGLLVSLLFIYLFLLKGLMTLLL